MGLQTAPNNKDWKRPQKEPARARELRGFYPPGVPVLEENWAPYSHFSAKYGHFFVNANF